MVIGACYFGEMLIPTPQRQAPSKNLTVMTTNVKVGRENPEEVVASIRKAEADVVAIQELNTVIAIAVQQELSNEYPYQILEPSDMYADGMGLLSRYPLNQVNIRFPDIW